MKVCEMCSKTYKRPHSSLKQWEARRFCSLKCSSLTGKTTTHGVSQTPIYHIWSGMMKRCYDKKCPVYKWYGGRGISISEEWKNPANFVKDMLPTYGIGLQIDRTDNNGNYEKGNCRWVTASENMRNRRTNRLITFRGETKTLTEWSEITGIKVGTIWARLNVFKHPIEKALTMRPQRRQYLETL